MEIDYQRAWRAQVETIGRMQRKIENLTDDLEQKEQTQAALQRLIIQLNQIIDRLSAKICE